MGCDVNESKSAQRLRSCGMLGSNDIVSNIASRTLEGKSIMLRILQIRSSVSLINESIVGKYG